MPPVATLVRIGHIRLTAEPHVPIALTDRPADDDGLAGASLGIADDNTTGRFTRQSFELDSAVAGDRQSALDALTKFAAAGIRLVVADLPAAILLPLADAAARDDILVFNAGAADDSLRGADCRGNMIHVTPSRAMLADALAQYLVWKTWTRWLLVVGSHPEDELYAADVRRAALRFGAEIVAEKVFADTGGARTTDSGTVQVQRLMPVFTQDAPDHDVLWVADESDVFGAYAPYRTWLPRPVVGTDGLRAVSWSPAHDQWGAIQLQNRFAAAYRRQMSERDFDAWTAVRMIGEAATRGGGADPQRVAAFVHGPDFAVAAFKGQKLTLRDWDGQLRQPILLADGRSVVSVSPQEGFLHPGSTLDTLGIDLPETECRL